MENESQSTENENKTIENNTPVSTPEKVSTPETETQQQINWRKFRQAREEERKQKLEAEKKAAEKEAEAQALKAALDALVSKPSNNHQENYESEESDEERIKRLIAAGIAEERKKEQEERAMREAAEVPQKLASTFNDFNQVCTSDNLDYLEFHYPEVAAAYRNLPDSFDKWVNVYKAVKRFVPNTDSKKEQTKAEKNFNKPQSMSIPGKTQVGDSAPHSLDDKRKSDNWARMQRVMRGG